jgi:dihydrofolate reductase
VVGYELLSLDGVAEAPETFFASWDDETDADLAAIISTQDAVILGRRTYDEWAAYWPEAGIEPFASFINTVTKLVATSTPLAGGWAGASAIEGDLGDAVRDLKAQPGGDIGVHASISVLRYLLDAGLVDELRLVIAPAIAGSGRRLLDGAPAVALECVESQTTPSGHLLMRYRVVR